MRFKAGRHLLLAVTALLWITACNKTEHADNTTTAKDFSLDYEKYQLENGLDVILHNDNSDPIVSVAILYHVGSNREKPGRTGFAHFFEHMLFQNSENLGKGNFIKRVNDMGGSFNGGTFQDGTIYFEVVPSDALEQILWMESDRMGFFINTVTKAGLENEKEVVKNEKRQSVDNRPYGHTRYVIDKNLYPEDHPYHWQVIGSLEDLQAATLDDVRGFYDTYYGVNNATLVIAGKFDNDETKALVKKYFGELKPREEVKPIEPRPAVLTETRKFYHEDNFAKLPELNLVFPTVEQYHDDSYALDMLTALLSDGKRAPLYKKIVEEKKLAGGVRMSQRSMEIAGQASISVRGFAGKDLDEVEAAIWEALAEFETEGPNETEMKRIRNMNETSFYNGLSSIFNKGFQLASYNEFAGDPGYVEQDLAKSLAVTAEDVMRVYRTYIKDKAHIATSFVPKGQVELALEGSAKAGVVEEKIVQGAEQAPPMAEEGEILRTASSFDRSVAPGNGVSTPREAPEVWTHELANGIKVYGMKYEELPLVRFSIDIKGGHYLDGINQSGLANLVASLMNEGTANRTPAELEEAIGLLGATIRVRATEEHIMLSGSCLARNYETLLAIAEEVLLQPRWDQAEFDRIKTLTINRIRQRSGEPNGIAATVFGRLLYGENHVLSQDTIGTAETVEAITLDDLKAFYERNFSPSVVSFRVAGKVDRDKVVASLKNLDSRWQAKVVEFPTYTLPEPISKPRLFFVDVPDAKQSVINIGNMGPSRKDADWYPCTVANYRLGDGSGSILFEELRLKRGYTYGAYSFYGSSNDPAPFQASSGVRANVTLESIQVFKDIIEGYAADFGEEDLTRTRSALKRGNASRFETLGNLMVMLYSISSYGLPTDYVKQEELSLDGMSVESIKTLLARRMDPNSLTYLVVGDAKTQLPRLKKTGLGTPILLDRNGKVIQ